ncbi:MAG: MarR family transcriptional regulator [Gemmatimonadota bacterium]
MAEPLRFVSPLHKATRQIGEYLADDCRRLGVEPAEGHMLSYTHLYGPCPPSELTRVFGHKPSTLTGMLDRLEAKALLVRDPNPEDRRSNLIRVTEEGASIAQRLRGQLEDLERAVRARVGSRNEQGFRSVMKAIADITQIQLKEEDEKK